MVAVMFTTRSQVCYIPISPKIHVIKIFFQWQLKVTFTYCCYSKVFIKAYRIVLINGLSKSRQYNPKVAITKILCSPMGKTCG